MEEWYESIKKYGADAYLHWEYQSKYDHNWYPMTAEMFKSRTKEREKYAHFPEQLSVRRKYE